MAFIARLIQGAGWLWIATGIAGQIFGFADIGWFPGIILVFIARVLRAQTSRQPRSEETPASTAPERPLNTERSQEPTREPSPEPVVVTEPAVVIEPVEPRKPVVTEREPIEVPQVVLEPSQRSVKSSEEMIAEARRRWDRRR
jgi:hypothetical protein